MNFLRFSENYIVCIYYHCGTFPADHNVRKKLSKMFGIHRFIAKRTKRSKNLQFNKMQF